MCGIAGSFNADANVKAMLEAIKHRGPDAEGYLERGEMIFGHRRLSIMDPTPRSDCPFEYRGGVLILNGEIWNFKQLRSELELKGHIFQTTGDTEVLAAALTEWGIDALQKLEGMYAFAWSQDDLKILVRDRFGKIPLYIAQVKDGWVWASERKAFLPVGIKPQVQPLKPGCYLDLTTGFEHRYYTIHGYPHEETLADLLVDAVKARMMSDVGFCCLISGGLDSTIILSIAKRFDPDVIAYTAVFDKDSKDAEASRKICKELNVELREVPIPNPTLESLEKAIYSTELYQSNQVQPAYLFLAVSEQISKDGFKVTLCGDGSDELFGGYHFMQTELHAEGQPTDEKWFEIRKKAVKNLEHKNFSRNNKSFMAHGVECRLPFLSRKLVEKVMAMGFEECPPEKGALKAAVQGLIPDWVIKRPKVAFDAGTGIDKIIETLVSNPKAYYNQVYKRLFVERQGLFL